MRALIGPGPYQRALLIEYLHQIQDTEGCLPAGYLHGLAELLRIPMAEVYEVATFYAHFDVVGDGEAPPARVTIRVCDSLSCMLAGAEALKAALERERPEDVRVVNAPCIGACDKAPAVQVDAEETRGPMTLDDADAMLDELRSSPRPEKLWR